MIDSSLSEDTQAIMLLCGVFQKDSSSQPKHSKQPKNLSSKEYSLLAHWLYEVGMRPGDLLQEDIIHEASMGSGIDEQRLKLLLGRGIQLGFAVEEWQRNGIWIISRSDADYPARYKKHLKDRAPPLLLGVGDRSLVEGGGLGIVGSRNVDQAGEAFTCKVAEICASNDMPVVSGGARGVDQTAMDAALEAGGVAIGILAENLAKKSVKRNARHAIADGRLLLLSPYHPNARFTVGKAMARNKLIYAMSDYGLVVHAEHKKGGTWAGAEEELKRKNALPVFVRLGDGVPQGNSKLLNLGAISWPDSIDRSNFRQQLHDLAVSAKEIRAEKDSGLFHFRAVQQAASADELPPATDDVVRDQRTIAEPEPTSDTGTPEGPESIYQAALPFILNELDSSATAKELAEALDVKKTQLNEWLKKAVDENRIIKLSKPVRYQKAKSGKLL